MYAEKNFNELKKKDRRVEMQVVYDYLIVLTTRLPDHLIAIKILEHQGVVNLALENYTGAVKSF